MYVTTGYFSESVQREILEDQHPIVLINGRTIEAEISKTLFERKIDLVGFLSEIDKGYEARIRFRRAEEILLE